MKLKHIQIIHLMIIIILLIISSFIFSGCSVIWNDDELAVSFFSGAVAGSMDPNTGEGKWTRVGNYEASGIEIIKDGSDCIIQFDQAKSKTEFDKMKFFFEAGVAAGKKVTLP